MSSKACAQGRAVRAFARKVKSSVGSLPTPTSVAACASLVVALLHPCIGRAQLSIGGSHSVSDNGAATYEVPIPLPPGIGGVQPQLALNYNSQAPNGPLGLGWNLGGLSSITRCPRTKAQDGYNRWIAWDATDAYCLNGQKLFPIADPANSTAAVGANGGNGTYYATEQESFSKIQSFTDPATNGGAAYFIVRTKSGLVMEYGRTSDSRIEAQGRTAVRVWALNKVSDSKSNYFTVNYLEDAAVGQLYPARIDYTGNASTALAPANSIVFDYGTQLRPDKIGAYTAGSLVRTDRLLRNINTYASGSLVARFALTYINSSATGRSQLTQIDRFDASGASLLPTKIVWTTGGRALVNKGVAISGIYANWADASNRIRVMDVDGDSRQDIVLGPDTNGTWFWLQSNGTGFTNRGTIAVAMYGNWATAADRIRVMDVDGDGRQDIVMGPDTSGNWFWLQSTGSAFVNRGALATGIYTNWSEGSAVARTRVIDVDGDGRQDIVLGPDDSGGWYWLQSTGSAFVNRGRILTATYSTWSTATNRVRVMDVNGDGQQDIVLGPDTSGNWFWLRGTDSGFVNAGVLITAAYADWSSGPPAEQIHTADVNGDGLMDIVLGPDSIGGWYWLQSTGVSFVNRGRLLSNVHEGWATATSRVRSMELNGDGRTDIVLGPDGSGSWLSVRSTGEGFTADGAVITGAYSGWASATDRTYVADVNGDGLSDIVFGPDGSGNWFWMAASGGPELVQSIDSTGGLNPVSFTYKPLTDSSVYTKGSGSVYPVADLQVPTYVISQVTTGRAGATNTTRFTYGGLKVGYGPNARGLLGFNWTQSEQLDTGLVKRTYYRQDFPFLGVAERTGTGTSSASWSNLTLTTYTYTCNDFVNPIGTCPVAPGKRYFVYAAQSDEQGWDLNGAGLPRNRTTQTMDNFGNALTVTVDTLNPDGSASGYSKSTTNVYSNDPVNWNLGRLLKSSVTVTTP